MKLPYRPRFLNKIWAFIFGYFWLPCPLCGNKFGGHECWESLMVSYSEGVGVCPKCITKAKEQNAAFFLKACAAFYSVKAGMK